MFSLRNKELQRLLFVATATIILFSIIGFSIGKNLGILLLLQGLLLSTYFFSFSIYRYSQIKKLSKYLSRIRQGESSLDLRDNKEGELSILKNEIYKVTVMLSEYNERLKEDKILLAEHMANISHQLKTPLTSMMVMVDLLKDENLPLDKRKQFTAKIYSQLERIEWLVTSLLTISKLDAGVLKMKAEKVKGEDLIQASIEPLLIPLEIKDITFHLEGGHNYLYCDRHWTREAILNILKNCIEHTKPGGRLEITISDNPLYSGLKIRDTGVGIAKEDLPHIFTRFYRGKNSSNDSVGIGLSMSYSIIQNQGGDITVNSLVGKGSVFYIKLYKSVI